MAKTLKARVKKLTFGKPQRDNIPLDGVAQFGARVVQAVYLKAPTAGFRAGKGRK